MTAKEEPLQEAIKKNLKRNIEPLEKRLGISAGFFSKLPTDTGGDWSFIIKLYALIEIAVAHYLSTKLNKSELQETFLRLDLASRYSSQIAFLRALDLLNNHRSYICALASIRNAYAHDISNVMLKFEEYFQKDIARDPLKQLKAACRKIYPALKEDSIDIMLRKSPVFLIWLLGMDLLAEIYQGIKLDGTKLSEVFTNLK